MAFAEISVDQKFHPHIIGKNGANGKQPLSNMLHYLLIVSNKIMQDFNVSCIDFKNAEVDAWQKVW